MIQKSSILGMGMLFAIALLMIFSLNNPSGSKLTGMFVIEPDTKLEDINSTYSLVPLFETTADYSLGEYDTIISQAKVLISQCRGTDPVIVNTCVTAEIATQHGWTIVERQDFMYKFNVEGKNEIPLYDEVSKKLENKPVIYMFALDFSE
jgi:hypothetical protein